MRSAVRIERSGPLHAAEHLLRVDVVAIGREPVTSTDSSICAKASDAQAMPASTPGDRATKPAAAVQTAGQQGRGDVTERSEVFVEGAGHCGPHSRDGRTERIVHDRHSLPNRGVVLLA